MQQIQVIIFALHKIVKASALGAILSFSPAPESRIPSLETDARKPSMAR